MSYTIEGVVKMINAGFTADEIRALDTDGLFTYAADSAPADPAPADPPPANPAPAADPAPADPAPAAVSVDELKQAINDGFAGMLQAFQTAAVVGSNQNMLKAKTSEDILAEVISPQINKGV